MRYRKGWCWRDLADHVDDSSDCCFHSLLVYGLRVALDQNLVTAATVSELLFSILT